LSALIKINQALRPQFVAPWLSSPRPPLPANLPHLLPGRIVLPHNVPWSGQARRVRRLRIRLALGGEHLTSINSCAGKEGL
jgi:hypothetical protein